MNIAAHPGTNSTTRREFLKTSSKAVAGAALTAAIARPGYTAEANTIQVALVGCGGRGTGAAANALATTSGPIKLVAMADAFENKLKSSHGHLSKNEKTKTMVEVPEEKQFLGFDAYKKAMDCLKPGDVVILTTPPAFRWVHFTYAIQKGLNVFMEKPVTVDGPTSRKMLKLADESAAKKEAEKKSSGDVKKSAAEEKKDEAPLSARPPKKVEPRVEKEAKKKKA